LPIAFVHYLTSLTTFCIINNDLNQLPPLLGFHKRLQQIQVDGNPLKSIRRQIIDKGAVGLMTYLRDKYRDGIDNKIEEWALQWEREEAQQQQDA
jgi:Leucine-rich repeat (LRR) protein